MLVACWWCLSQVPWVLLYCCAHLTKLAGLLVRLLHSTIDIDIFITTWCESRREKWPFLIAYVCFSHTTEVAVLEEDRSRLATLTGCLWW